MSDLLPSRSTPEHDPEPRVLGVDSDEAGEAISALSSETTRELLGALHEEPATASGMADRLDLTLQNVQYHLGKLDDAELVEVADTVYSEKGREMKVYAPADGPLVVFTGDKSEAAGLQAMLKRLLAGIAGLAVTSLLVQAWLGEPPLPVAQTGSADSEAMTVDTATTAAATATGLPPGLLFFLGGVVVLLAVTAGWWYRQR
ncbi:ArsR/SmtB family transcription factor [Halolamina sp.]|uniref:ArsR/SmtB family transcription factor n=1 Tax=Halolamina sp. TaxID=1940283 RepID=UPI003567173E